MTYPQVRDSKQICSLGGVPVHATKEAAQTSVSTADLGLNTTADKERAVSLTLNTPGFRPVQDTPKVRFDGIAARDEFLRKEMERGSEKLLRAMIRELESMGVLRD